MRTHLTLLAALLLLAVAAPAAEARDASARYVAPTLYTTQEVTGLCDLPADAGGACFAIVRGERSVALAVEDATGKQVPAAYFFYNGGGSFVSGGTFCGSASRVSIPSTAAKLVVNPDIVLGGPCSLSAGIVGTTGTIRATFT